LFILVFTYFLMFLYLLHYYNQLKVKVSVMDVFGFLFLEESTDSTLAKWSSMDLLNEEDQDPSASSSAAVDRHG